jgi:hypothetical protein
MSSDPVGKRANLGAAPTSLLGETPSPNGKVAV